MQVKVLEINDTEDNKKRVCFTVTANNDEKYVIDKRVDKSDKKTIHDYINEAYAKAKPEIDKWIENVSDVGKTINLETGKLNTGEKSSESE